MTPLPENRLRYPLRAQLGIALAALFALAELAVFALWMMPMIPLVPVFISVMLGNGFVLASVVEWAKAQRTSARMVRRPLAETARHSTRSSAASAHAA